MIKTIILCSVCFVMIQACNLKSDNKTADIKLTDAADFKLVDRERCSFKLPNDLVLEDIDTSKFSKEGYFKIKPSAEAGMMQIFVFNDKSDIDNQIKLQEAALNNDKVFTASKITPVSRWGKYNGKGLLMNGTYNGGIVKGKITIFGYSTNKSSFLIIRQDISSHNTVRANFDFTENSFTLK